MNNERINVVERLSVLSVAVVMLAGCAGMKTTPPVAAPNATQRVAQDDCRLSALSGASVQPMLIVCGGGPPPYTVTTVFINNLGYNFDTNSYNVPIRCYFFGNVAYEGGTGCRNSLPTVCGNSNKWGCIRNLTCEQLYAKDKQLAPYAAQAYLMVGTDALVILAIPGVAETAAAYLGVSVALLKTTGGLALFVATYRGYWSGMTQTEAPQYIRDYGNLQGEEYYKGCITVPVGP